MNATTHKTNPVCTTYLPHAFRGSGPSHAPLAAAQLVRSAPSSGVANAPASSLPPLGHDLGRAPTQQNPLQWGSGGDLDSTYDAQVFDAEFATEMDWDDRFYQFRDNFNDRAWDSPACINDGECPVNFSSAGDKK